MDAAGEAGHDAGFGAHRFRTRIIVSSAPLMSLVLAERQASPAM